MTDFFDWLVKNKLVLFIFAAILILLWTMFRSEKFQSVLYTAGGSSVNCLEFPQSPNCQPPPNVGPVPTGLETCTPSDGVWSSGGGVEDAGRSKLLSPCCQPPNYTLAQNMKTCDSDLDPSNSIDKCIINCCTFADNQANNYDPSWYPMARCACSLWCYNQHVPHFKKYGTAVHYISGDIAEAKTAD